MMKRDCFFLWIPAFTVYILAPGDAKPEKSFVDEVIPLPGLSLTLLGEPIHPSDRSLLQLYEEIKRTEHDMDKDSLFETPFNGNGGFSEIRERESEKENVGEVELPGGRPMWLEVGEGEEEYKNWNENEMSFMGLEEKEEPENSNTYDTWIRDEVSLMELEDDERKDSDDSQTINSKTNRADGKQQSALMELGEKQILAEEAVRNKNEEISLRRINDHRQVQNPSAFLQKSNVVGGLLTAGLMTATAVKNPAAMPMVAAMAPAMMGAGPVGPPGMMPGSSAGPASAMTGTGYRISACSQRQINVIAMAAAFLFALFT